MESTLNTLGSTSPNDLPAIVILAIGDSMRVIQKNFNLVPSAVVLPDNEAVVKMMLDTIRSKFYPAPHVLKAKLDHILSGTSDDVRENIFVTVLAQALLIVETFNNLQLWSENGYAMYEFSHFINEDAVALRKVNKF